MIRSEISQESPFPSVKIVFCSVLEQRYCSAKWSWLGLHELKKLERGSEQESWDRAAGYGGKVWPALSESC